MLEAINVNCTNIYCFSGRLKNSHVYLNCYFRTGPGFDADAGTQMLLLES